MSKKTMVIDFTGKVESVHQSQSFDEQLMQDVRGFAADNEDAVFVLVDTGFGGNLSEVSVIADHLNLTGDNPLAGPNHPIGERFPVVNNVYCSLNELKDSLGLEGANGSSSTGIIVAGVKPGVVPTDEEIALISKLGADFYCYNLVPAALVAAHARKKVGAILVSPKMKQVKNIDELVGGLS